jgi:hypothetical protein
MTTMLQRSDTALPTRKPKNGPAENATFADSIFDAEVYDSIAVCRRTGATSFARPQLAFARAGETAQTVLYLDSEAIVGAYTAMLRGSTSLSANTFVCRHEIAERALELVGSFTLPVAKVVPVVSVAPEGDFSELATMVADLQAGRVIARETLRERTRNLPAPDKRDASEWAKALARDLIHDDE